MTESWTASEIAEGLMRYIKESPGAGDVHTDNAGGGAKRRKKPVVADQGAVVTMTLDSEDPMLDDDADEATEKKFEAMGDVIKVDESLGIVFGWAMICKKDGEEYWDLQDNYIPESSMLKASVDFMQNSRVAKEMHDGDEKGSVVFAFPMTTDIAKSFGIDTATTGLMIAIKPNSDEMLAKFRDGTFTGFSIGGYHLQLDDEEVD